MAYTFEQVFAADPANPSNIAQNASITIFAPGDGTMTPIAITDPDGQPLANPIPVNANGFGSAFMADIDRVAWLGGGFTGFFTSYEGMKEVAVAAQAAAETAASTAGADAAAVADAAVASVIADADAAAASAATSASNASASATAAANSAALVGAPADTAVETLINSASATKAALNATYAPYSGPFEMVGFTGFGHSYVEGIGVVLGTAFYDRVASRLRTRPYVNRGIGGYRTDQILASIEANWAPDARGIVGLMVTLNDVGQYLDTAGALTSAECFRSSLAFLTSRASLPITSASFSYGPGWTTGTASSGSYVDFAWTGDAAYIRIGAVTGAGGTVTVTNGANNTVLKTFSTGGFKQNFNAVIPLRGLGGGQHNVRIAVTAGSVTLTGALIPTSTPPAIIWAKEGRFKSETDEHYALLNGTYLPALATVAAEFPAVKPVEPVGWDMNTMLGVDQVHPNDVGSLYWADRVVKAIYEFIPVPRDGVNVISMMASGTYVQVTPVYTAPGATVPAQVTGVTATTAQAIDVAWTAPADGGSTITGYTIRYRVTGESTWDSITVAGSARAVTLAAGILGGTSYEIEVAATNGIGTGIYSATVTQTSGIIPYAVDNFDRANSASLGSTPTGGYAWTQTASAFSIFNNTLSVANTGASKVTITESNTDGTLEMKLSSWTSGLVGLSFRGTTGQDGEYVFYAGESTVGYSLKKRTATDAYTTIANASPNTPVVAGAVLTVVLNGTSIICKVNGVTVITATDATYTGTQKGVFARLTVGSTIDYWKWTP